MPPSSISPATLMHARAALWEGQTGIGTSTLPMDPVEPGAVLVRVEMATVCGCVRDAVRERSLLSLPTVLGHEGVGTIVAVGRGQEAVGVDGVSLAPGMRIVWGRDVGCGECAYCLTGDTDACRGPRELGRQPLSERWSLSGSLATHLTLPPGAAMVVVPPGIPDGVAAPAGCAFAVAAAAVERAGRVAGARVVVLGAGLVGLATLAMVVEAGAASATVVEPRPKRRRRALAFGADAALDVSADLPACDILIDAAGGVDTWVSGVDSLAPMGVAVLAAVRAQVAEATIDLERISKQGLSLLGLGRPAARHLGQAVSFLGATHAMRPWASIVSEPVGLEQVVEAVAHSGGRIARVAVRPQH